MNRKVKSFIQTVFCRNNVCSQSYNKCSKCSLSTLTQVHNRFAISLFPVDNTLFQVSPEIRCSGLSSRYCCYGNDAADSKPIQLFIVSIKNWITSLPTINRLTSQCRELWSYVILIVAVRFFETQLAYEFLLAFHTNCGSILYHFWDKARYWSKFRAFIHPSLDTPTRGSPSEYCHKI